MAKIPFEPAGQIWPAEFLFNVNTLIPLKIKISANVRHVRYFAHKKRRCECTNLELR